MVRPVTTLPDMLYSLIDTSRVPPYLARDAGSGSASLSPHSSPSSCRLVMYLTMIGAATCGMSLCGPIFAAWTADRKWSVGAMDPRIGFSGR